MPSALASASRALKFTLLDCCARSAAVEASERQTRYVMLVKLEGKDSQTVVNALIKNARKLPQELYKSLTWDRGIEMHAKCWHA